MNAHFRQKLETFFAFLISAWIELPDVSNHFAAFGASDVFVFWLIGDLLDKISLGDSFDTRMPASMRLGLLKDCVLLSCLVVNLNCSPLIPRWLIYTLRQHVLDSSLTALINL